MHGHSSNARPTTANRLLVFLCLALFAFSVTAQTLHFHLDQSLDTAKHCPICPALHSVAPPAHSVQLDFSFTATAILTPGIDSQQHTNEASFALFSRPPPSLA